MHVSNSLLDSSHEWREKMFFLLLLSVVFHLNKILGTCVVVINAF